MVRRGNSAIFSVTSGLALAFVVPSVSANFIDAPPPPPKLSDTHSLPSLPPTPPSPLGCHLLLVMCSMGTPGGLQLKVVMEHMQRGGSHPTCQQAGQGEGSRLTGMRMGLDILVQSGGPITLAPTVTAPFTHPESRPHWPAYAVMPQAKCSSSASILTTNDFMILGP